MVELLIEKDAVCAMLQRNRKKLHRWRLTVPLGSLGLVLKKDNLPIAEDCRTLTRLSLGDCRFVHQFVKRRAEAYSPENRRAFA